jgi:hypothetical protein
LNRDHHQDDLNEHVGPDRELPASMPRFHPAEARSAPQSGEVPCQRSRGPASLYIRTPHKRGTM